MNRTVHHLTALFRQRWKLVALALSAFVITSCTEGVDVSSIDSDKVKVPLRAYYAGPVEALSSASAVNRIRVTVKIEPNGPTLPPQIFDVVDQPEWTLDVDLPITKPENVTVLVELMTGETTEFSGRVGPIRVAPGAAPTTAPSVPVFPGPPSNLDITSLSITGAAPVIEGSTVQLGVNVVGPAGTRVTWSSLDPTIATVDANGLVRTLLPGTARIQASAGPRTDVASIAVGRRMSRIEVTPATQAVTALGQEVTFGARVFDPRNAEFTGVGIEWTSSDPSVAAHVGGGRFRALKAGSATVTARVAGSTTLSATGRVTVSQTVNAVTISPSSATLESIGATATFAAKATDSGGAEITGLTFTWSSSAPTVATVNGAGVVTAVGNGSATITATAEGKSASAAVTVAQRATGITITPPSHTFTAIGQSVRFSASAVDARGNPVSGATLTWGTNNSAIATVDENGNVTATGRGATSIFVTSGSGEARATVTVNQAPGRIVITPTSASIGVGGTVTFTASVRDANGHPIPGAGATWSTSTPEILSVTNAGLATGLKAGDGIVVARAGTASAFANVKVSGEDVRTGPIKVGAIGANSGNRAANRIFTDGDLTGTIERLDATTFNAIATADLRARFDVIIVTWASSSSLNVDWATRLRPFIEAGGGVIYEDPNNLADIAAIVPGALVEPGGYPIRRISGVNVPGLTDGINDSYANNHIGFKTWDSALKPFLEADDVYDCTGATCTLKTMVVGLYGAYGAGRIVLTGPDQDFHAHKSGTTMDNQYKLLINEIRWVSKRAPTAGQTGARPLTETVEFPTLRAESVRRQQDEIERIRARAAQRVNKGSN